MGAAEAIEPLTTTAIGVMIALTMLEFGASVTAGALP